MTVSAVGLPARGRLDGGGPDIEGRDLRRLERAENFPVALRLLPGRYRTHLRALYDVARYVDDLGDEAAGDRTSLLHEFATDLARVWSGERPATPVLRTLQPTVRACRLSREPFEALVRANLVDQRTNRYPTYADLRDYCRLSADPVGRVVLEIFHASTPATRRLSDRVCTALQLVEHCQDVAEDLRRDRVYLPLEDLRRFAVTDHDLRADTASSRVRELLRFETDRAAALLDSGALLVGVLHGWARIAVAGYVAGGRAAIAAVRKAGYDVLRGAPKPARPDLVRALATTLVTAS